jgi:uncharacterized membrane protein
MGLFIRLTLLVAALLALLFVLAFVVKLLIVAALLAAAAVGLMFAYRLVRGLQGRGGRPVLPR